MAFAFASLRERARHWASGRGRPVCTTGPGLNIAPATKYLAQPREMRPSLRVAMEAPAPVPGADKGITVFIDNFDS